MRNVTFASGLIAVAVTVLVACGGGSSSNTATTPTTPTTPVTPTPPALVNPVTVVPAMGGFSAGANVAFLQPNGTVIGSGTTDATGTAVVPLGSYSGPFISQVTGGPNVTVYNERTQGFEAFGATNSLLAIVPSTAGFTTGSARLGVTPFTNAAAAVLIPNPASPTIPGSTATIQAAVAVANATVAVSLGLPPGTSLLTAPAPLTSSTSKITTTDSNAALLSALLTSLELSSKGSLLATVSGLATDAAANKGALPSSAALITSANAQLSSVISQNVAAASLTSISSALTTLVSNSKPDPTLANASSLAAITSLATTANGGAALPATISIPTAVAPAAGTTVSTGTNGSTTVVIAAPPAPPAPAAPAAPAGSNTSSATVTTTCSDASGALISPVTVYATVPNSASVTPLSSYTATTSTLTATAVGSNSNISWSSTAPTFTTASQTYYSYSQISNTSNCASGTYTTSSGTQTINASTVIYVLNATSTNTSGLFTPSCPSSVATSTGTIVVTSNGLTFTGSVINGTIFGFFPQSGASGSGLFTGTVSGSSGSGSGLVLGTGATSNLAFTSVSGSTLNNIVPATTNVAVTPSGSTTPIYYNVIKNTSAQIVLACSIQ